MTVVYLGLGANLGDRRANLINALAGLTPFCPVRQTSRLYETAPVGITDQPVFLNMAVRAETALPPLGLLAALKALEQRLGRGPGLRWGPRLIDIDILLYGDGRFSGDGLDIPHPRLLERRFALAPLADVAGGVHHPISDRTIADHLADLPEDGDVVVLEDGI